MVHAAVINDRVYVRPRNGEVIIAVVVLMCHYDCVSVGKQYTPHTVGKWLHGEHRKVALAQPKVLGKHIVNHAVTL